ncbi:putative short-chain dehydrogenase [Fusarium oxysporum Fo47]|nr:putative short-chain dehydrogenase [Fusarium oxysporum Fo47]QKD50520.2 putative short-chain dehydrogenase [Fusarium oxysporum Fo47]
MGANVAVLDIQDKSRDAFSSVENEFGTNVFYFQTDVTKLDSLNAGVDKAIEALGSLDGCLPCAGINCNKPFVDQSWDEFTRIQEINVRGTFFTVQRVVKQLIKQGTSGSIVMMASQCAHIAIPGCRMSSYNASKGGVLMLTKALGVELAKHNIRVNSISPGYVDSQMFRDVLATQSERDAKQPYQAPPLRRLSDPNDLTPAIIYLFSDASRHITATDIKIMGGLDAGQIDGHITYE